MNKKSVALQAALQDVLGLQVEISAWGEVAIEIQPEDLLPVCRQLKDNAKLAFAQLIDLAGVDYSEYQGARQAPARYAAVYHLLSFRHNWRLRLRVFVASDPPLLDSVTSLWSCADWYEREAFDLFGIIFEGHNDLRRILTDYGFIGHPFRKDFPLIGQVEMRYDPERRRVVYEPVSIKPRVTVPRVVRSDHRYDHPGEGE